MRHASGEGRHGAAAPPLQPPCGGHSPCNPTDCSLHDLSPSDYLSIDASTGTITPLFPGVPAATPAAALAAAIAVVSPSEVLLTRGWQSLFYGPEGRPSRQRNGGGGIRWSAPPLAVLAAAPFAVAVVGDGGKVEARPLEPLSLTALEQQLTLPASSPLNLLPPPSAPAAAAAALSAPSPRLFVGTRCANEAGAGAGGGGSGEVHALLPLPAAEQAAQLLALGEHEEALAMCGLVPPAEAEARRALEDRIHLAYGRRLFRRGQYDAAMLHLGMSGLAGPVQLLRLLPSLAPAHLLRAAAEAEEEARGPGLPAADEDDAEEEGVEGPAAGPVPGTEEFQEAVAALMPYLLSHRSRLATAAAGSSPSTTLGGNAAAKAAAVAGEAAAGGGGGSAALAAMERSPSARAEAAADAAAEAVHQRLSSSPLAVLVDTALLRVLLALPDSGALLRFVSRPNCVDGAVGEAALRGVGRYSELVALHQSRGQHAAALGLLRTLSQAPGELPTPPRGAAAELPGLPGVWAAVRYLCQLHPPPADLLATHARWECRCHRRCCTAPAAFAADAAGAVTAAAAAHAISC